MPAGIDSVGEALPVAKLHARAFDLDIEYLEVRVQPMPVLCLHA